MNDIKEKYTCDACRYTFESDKLPDRCPDCGKLQVRRASESEIYEYEHRFDNANYGYPISLDTYSTPSPREKQRFIASNFKFISG